MQWVTFWTALSAAATLGIWYVAWKQLKDINRTAKADFIHRFSKDFFTPECRKLIALFENDLLKFRAEQSKSGQELGFFELDNDLIKDFEDIINRKTVKEKYSSHELDDYLLGYFEDIGNFEKRGLLEMDAIYGAFSYYIALVWENKEIQKYVTWARADGDDIYRGFENIYKKIKSYS